MGLVKRREQARCDIDSAMRYLVKHASPRVAEGFRTACRETFLFLIDNPNVGKLLDEDDPQLSGIRKWRVEKFGSYLILYRRFGQGVEIIRVMHTSRDLKQEYERTDWP